MRHTLPSALTQPLAQFLEHPPPFIFVFDQVFKGQTDVVHTVAKIQGLRHTIRIQSNALHDPVKAIPKPWCPDERRL
jgi:hypothetical protein